MNEIAFAVFLFDLALLVMTVTWTRTTNRPTTSSNVHASARQRRRLSRTGGICVAILMIALGLWAMYWVGFAARHTGREFGAWTTSSYLYVMLAWPVFAMALLFYLLGFNKVLILIALPIWAISAVNAARFVVVTGTILVVFVHLARKRRRWPSIPWMASLALLAVLWLPLKTVAESVRSHDPLEVMSSRVGARYEQVLIDGDTMFLDMAAAIISLSDERELKFFGVPWTYVFVLPVPRQWWPEKPRVNEHMFELQTDARPVGTMGMMPMLVGDSYINFGVFGVIFVSWLVARCTGWGYMRARTLPVGSVGLFLFLLVDAVSVQLYRDGLFSAALFTVVTFYPLVGYAAVHFMITPIGIRRKRMIARDAVITRPPDREPITSPAG